MQETIKEEPQIIAVPINSKAKVSIRIIRGNGEIINLGKAGSILYKIKLWLYKRKLKKEQKNG